MEDLRGGRGNDLLIGDADGNRLEGGIGNHFIVGGAGADTLTGSDGDDTMFAGGLGHPGLGTDDGVRDFLFASTGFNTCVFSATDPDVTSGC